MTPANDNGPMGVDWRAISSEFSSFLADALRVMRGHGRPERVVGGVEYFGTILSEQPRSQVSACLLNGAYRWHDIHVEQYNEIPDNDNQQRARDISRAEFEICLSSLRLVASQIDGNRAELSKSRTDIMQAVEQYRAAFTWSDAEEIEGPAVATVSAPEEPVCYVYFIHNGEAIKIGKSINPSKRMAGLQTSYHKPLTLLATMEGGTIEEAGLHMRFNHLRLSGEWFSDDPQLREFIESKSQESVKWPHKDARIAA